MPHMIFSMSRSTALQMVVANTPICEFISRGLKLISHLPCLPVSSFVKAFGERQTWKGNGWLQKATEHQDHKEHPQSLGEGNHSGGSWEEGKPPALDNQRAGVASSHIHCCSSSLPTLPHGGDECRSKAGRTIQGTWMLAAPLPSPELRAKPLSAGVPMKRPDSEQWPAQPSSSPKWLSLFQGQWFLFLFDCRADMWGWWCLQGDKWFPGRGGQMCYSTGRVSWWRGDFRVPICVPKASIPSRLKSLETTHLWHLCREEHLCLPWNR